MKQSYLALLFAGAVVLSIVLLNPVSAQTVASSLGVTGGTYRMFTHGVDPAKIHVAAHSLDGKAHTIQVSLAAEDISGKPVNWTRTASLDLPPAGTEVTQDFPFDMDQGYYQILGQFKSGGEKVSHWTDLGIIPPPYPGVRPDSFFASNTSGLKTGNDLKFLQMIGMKIQRAHFQPPLAGKPPAVATGGPLPINFTRHDDDWEASKAAGIWAIPIAGYSLSGDLTTPLAHEIGMYGPPRDDAEFVNTWEQILRHYPELTTVEFWNEPWIFGWTWAANGAEYRKLQKMFCEMALKVNPKYRILAGNSSMFAEDHIEVDPGCYQGLLSGITHHPYSYSVGAATLRAGDQLRSIDSGTQAKERMGLPFYYRTEGGEQYTTPPTPEMDALNKKRADLQKEIQAVAPADRKGYLALQAEMAATTVALAEHPNPYDNDPNAYKVVQYYINAALDGCFMGNAQWEIGYGPGWTKSNVAFATMTHFLEDRPIMSEIWPENELVHGAIFANPKFATDAVKALPRAKDLSVRWSVPVPADRADDATKAAVIWCETGTSNDHVDSTGTLTIGDSDALRAYDMTGREIPARNGRLTVPFGEYPVYITTDKLDVIQLRTRIAGALIQKLTPVNLYALSLARPADQAQSLSVRVENQLNRPVDGTLTVRMLPGRQTTSVKFSIPPAKLVEVEAPWPGVKPSSDNEYGVELTAKTDAGNITRQQVIEVARFVKRTITVDGSLDDWKGVAAVLLDSNQLQSGVDLTQYLLNPGLQLPTGTPENERIVARAYTAYDADNVYIAMAVNQDQFQCNAGQPVIKGRGATKVEVPYKEGMPDGLDYISNCGDVLQFSFGFRDRVPGWGRQMDDPWAWKGHFYDTDYQYAANTSTEGDQLTREYGPDTTRHTAYQTEVVPGVGPVPGAKIVIKRDDDKKLTVYEMSIPRTELTMFDPAKGRCRFGFLLSDSEKVGPAGKLPWSDAAGVFDYWRSAGSFGPSWMQVLPCETFLGIEQ